MKTKNKNKKLFLKPNIPHNPISKIVQLKLKLNNLVEPSYSDDTINLGWPILLYLLVFIEILLLFSKWFALYGNFLILYNIYFLFFFSYTLAYRQLLL